ncbi:MAG TPA: glycosyltransferase [Planctomycetes bacterium]|nr:glycosyltransferase [Planctomycetota bacterium]
MAWLLLAVSTAVLYWIYDGYGRFLQLCVAIRRAITRPGPSETDAQLPWPEMTVLLTVHNEEAVIQKRITNTLECDYPADRLKILVASDGSTDRTSEIVRSIADERVTLMETPGLGKTGTQNEALKTVNSDIVVFTDADIVFDGGFLQRVAERFHDPQVGAVDGRLMYAPNAADANTTSQGFYWNYEMKVRHLESQLGWLAVVAGASFAVRRDLLQTMDPSIGEDCIMPLDVVQQGYLVVHEPLAKAFDEFEEGSGITLRRRIRQTLRNWQGTWSRPALLNPLRHPWYALALWSHKLLKWLSPVFLLIALFASCWLLATVPSAFSIAAALPYLLLFGMAGLGWLATVFGFRIPGTGVAFSFLLANTAFLVGIVRATLGRRIHSYRNA